MDRGRKNYRDFIMEKARVLGIERRICVMHDVHLPTCLKHAIGTVTINSTVGLSSLYHQTPTITLGNAIYDIEGLTCKGMALDEFWHGQRPPDGMLLEKYRRYLVHTTQLNGSFYGMMPEIDTAAVAVSAAAAVKKGCLENSSIERAADDTPVCAGIHHPGVRRMRSARSYW